MEVYRPLPEYLTIKESKIEGLGLHAVEDIKKTKIVGISHYEVDNYQGEDYEFKLIRTPLGGFINHSTEPNCVIRQEKLPTNLSSSLAYHWLVTKTEVEAGEELTVDYSKTFCGDYINHIKDLQ